jgi:signal peptidase II
MRRLLYLAIAASSVIVDQLVKLWAKTELAARPGGTIPIIDGVFHLTYLENRGAAFGLFQDQRWIFVVLTVAVSLGLLYVLFLRKPTMAKMPGIPLALILGGAVGNLIDRVMNGYVVDMFDARIINFAVFNVADSCLVCAIIAICVWMVVDEVIKKKQGAAHGENNASNDE